MKMMMQAMSEDDAAYSALLTQLLSDSAANRNARVHSWIEHQYDFALSEHVDTAHLPFASSRAPSPSPSSSLGAHRAYSIDRPDSPLLPRLSSDRTSSPCPSYDALFFRSNADDSDFEEQERLRALRFIVQEMAQYKTQTDAPSPQYPHDKALPAPPPSPASSVTQSTSSHVMRSRSSSTCISRLPSFTSTLSSEQSQPQEIPPPVPVSVIVHGELQHDLVLRHERPIVDAYLHKREDSLPLHQKEQDIQLLSAIQDDKDSVQPSPTLSSFSCALSRETCLTTPYASSPTSPTSVVFSPALCCPEDIALPASPLDELPTFKDLVHERVPPISRPTFPHSPSHASLPVANLLSAAITSSVSEAPPTQPEQSHRLRAPGLFRSQSRWSVATTASLTPSTTERKSGVLLGPKLTQEKKDKSLKTPKKRARFISLISRFSPGRADTSSVRIADDVEYDSANDSDAEDKEKNKPRKSLSKKSSLASLRASFSLSRASFSSQRPPVSSLDEVPPLPTSPTLASPLADNTASLEVVPVPPRAPLSRVSSRANLMNTPLPPIPQSASTITTFQGPSQLSVSAASAASASESRVSLAFSPTSPNASRISLLPASGKRISLASAAGVDPMVSTSSSSAPSATSRSKSIFRLTTKPKSIKAPAVPVTKGTVSTLSRLPSPNNLSLSSPIAAHSRIPHVPTKFTPPAKLASVIATQSRQIPSLASGGSLTSTSKLPVSQARATAKIPRAITLEKPPTESLPTPPSSRLPMPASTKGARVGTVRGFWKRQ